MKGQHEENGHIGRVANYLRVVGPQVKVIDAGAGDKSVRQAVALLEKDGLFVTALETSENPAAGHSMYYRGDAGKEAADRAAKLVTDSRVEELSKGGWVDLIVVLGGAAPAGATDADTSSCELKNFDFKTYQSSLASKKQLAQIKKDANKEYEEAAGGAEPGPAVRFGKDFIYPMVDCDGMECVGGIRFGKKWVVVKALTDGMDGTVEYRDIALADIDGDGAKELVLTWDNFAFGDDGMDSVTKLGVFSTKTHSAQLIHEVGICPSFELKVGSCQGGGQISITCDGKSATYQRAAKALKYRKK